MSSGGGSSSSVASGPTATAQAERVEPEALVGEAVSALDRAADKARTAVDRAMATPGASSTASTPPAPSPTPPAAAPPALAGLERESTLTEAAEALADDLMRIPGIQRFGDVRLADLDDSGPRPLRTMWRVARDKLEGDYGQLTIGEIIDRYRGSGGGSSGGVSTGA
jgi:hypothetical protein